MFGGRNVRVLALRDGRHRRAAAGIDLFGADHGGWLLGCALAAEPARLDRRDIALDPLLAAFGVMSILGITRHLNRGMKYSPQCGQSHAQ